MPVTQAANRAAKRAIKQWVRFQCAMGLVIVVIITLVSNRTGDAQTSYPMIMSLHPTATQIGQTTEHTISSKHSMYGATEVWVSGNGVTGEIVPPEVKVEEGKDPPNLQEIDIKFHVEENALPGVREFRIATPRGVSTIGQLVVGRNPVISELKDSKTNNDKIDQAQAVQVPATLCGNIEKAEDVDFYSFEIKEGSAYTFHVQSMRLQNKIHDLQQHSDPIITLRNSAGSTLATSDNYFYGDPFISYKFERGGQYSLEIRDVRYQGNKYWEYSIEVSDTPYVTNVYPMGIATNAATEVELIGHNLAETKAKLELDDSVQLGQQRIPVSVGSVITNPAPIIVTDLPLTLESSDDNNAPEKAQAIEMTVGVNGRLESEADIDCYSFAAKKGETFSFEVIARRHGSSMDSHMRILDEKGKQLQLNDDLKLGKRTYSDSWIENWSAPADGRFVVELRDLHLRGGPSFTYFLKVERSRPYFELFADTDKTLLTPGNNGVIFVRVQRKNGFEGEIQLEIDGLPAGVNASCGKILAGKSQDGCIVLTASTDAVAAMTNVEIRGKSNWAPADSEPIELSAISQPYQETYQPGGGRGHFPVSSHTVSIGEPNDIRSIELSAYDISLKPGESKQIDVTIQRAEGFDKNVTLDVIYKHLSSVYGDSLPVGVTLDGVNSKTLLSKGATAGHIVLKVADDAPPATKQQIAVMANVSLNFVMKATYASKPLFISVEAKE
jgi:hypothetical protein